jgi:chemotaxis protein MotB
MRHASGDLNPAQAIAQRMRAMETELQQARQALRRDRKRADVDRWSLEQKPADSAQEEGWFMTYLDMMTLLLVVMIVMLAFSGSIGKRAGKPGTAGQAGTQPVVAMAPIPEPDAPYPYPPVPADEIFLPPPPPAEPVHSPLYGTFPEFEPAPSPVPAASAGMAAPDGAEAPADHAAQPMPTGAPDVPETPAGSPSAATDHAAEPAAPGASTTAPAPDQAPASVPAPAAQPPAAEPEAPATATPPSSPSAGMENSRPASAPAVPEAKPEESSEGAALAASLPLGELGHDVEVIVNRRSISFRINSEILFGTGQADLSREGLSVLQRMAKVLSDAGYDVTVEGHTDSVPVRSNARYPSNWELSSARAGSVVRYLQANGISKGHLKAVGYADSRPIADNRTADGRARNRRVELVVEKPHEDTDDARPAR